MNESNKIFLASNEALASQITFTCDSSLDAVLILTKDGFTYKGKTIEDAGEAHELFLKFLKGATKHE